MNADMHQHLIQLVMSDDEIDQTQFRKDMASRAYDDLFGEPMPVASVGEGISSAGSSIGTGMAWGGFWIGMALVLSAFVLKGATL